jgi:hypothetical protein
MDPAIVTLGALAALLAIAVAYAAGRRARAGSRVAATLAEIEELGRRAQADAEAFDRDTVARAR